jgi:hypothetical protein
MPAALAVLHVQTVVLMLELQYEWLSCRSSCLPDKGLDGTKQQL